MYVLIRMSTKQKVDAGEVHEGIYCGGNTSPILMSLSVKTSR